MPLFLRPDFLREVAAKAAALVGAGRKVSIVNVGFSDPREFRTCIHVVRACAIYPRVQTEDGRARA
jgi:hypothetical protein